MALIFNGWGDSWGVTWGAREFDPNAMAGAATITFSAIGVLTALGVLEEHLQYYGGGQKSNEAIRYSEADILRLVEEKWQAIESSRGKPGERIEPKREKPRAAAVVASQTVIQPVELFITDAKQVIAHPEPKTIELNRSRANTDDDALILVLLELA